MTSTEPRTGEPTRRADIEAWLTERAVSFHFEPDLPISKIDRNKSLLNQARLEPIDQEVVDRYADDMRRGDEFPPVIAHDHGGRAKPSLIGGNHRLIAATQAGRKTIAAYVVTAEPETALQLTYEDNRRHGLPPSETERIVQGIHLLEIGWSQEQAAATVGVTSTRLSQERTMYKATMRAKELGIDMAGFNSLPRWSRYALGRLRSDPVFIEATSLALRARLTVDEVKDLAARLQETRSDADAMSVLGLEAEEMQARIQKTSGGRIRQKRTARAVAAGAMRDLLNRDPEAIVASIPTEAARDTMRKDVDATIGHLEALRKALK